MEKNNVVMTENDDVAATTVPVVDHAKTLFTKVLDENDLQKVMIFLDKMAAKGCSRVAFLDTPCCQALHMAIDFAVRSLRFQVYLKDHHGITEVKSSRDEVILKSAEAIRTLLGPKATIVDRQTAPACSKIIEAGEFPEETFLIIADGDPDGLTATMKARGLVYSELDHDSAVLDGPHSQRTIGNLSRLGWKIHQVFATVNEKNRQSVFEKFLDYVTGDPAAEIFIESTIEEYEAQVNEAERLAQTAEKFTSKIWLVDVTSAKKYDTATLSRLIEANDGCQITVIVKNDGPIGKLFGKQYSIALKNGVQGIDFKQILPAGFVSSPEAGLICNTPFLMHCNQEQWQTVVLLALATIK